MAEFIRPIRKEDIAQIVELEKRCFAMPWSEESIRKDVEENVVACWLVMDDGEGRVLAYAGMWFVLDEAHVCNVAVHPDCRRMGYGRRIMEALMQLDNELHHLLFRIARKEQSWEIMTGFMAHFDRVRSMSLGTVNERNVADHRAIVRAVVDGNAEEARRMMESHLSRYKVDETTLREHYPASYFKTA